MINDPLIFQKCEPRIWHGRYDRIMGDSGIFHVRDHHVVIEWEKNEETGYCTGDDTPAMRELVKSIISAKRRMGGNIGGGFIINEWGQVIVPAPSGDGTRMIVGSIKGKILFENPFADNVKIDLSRDDNLTCGDLWPRPYIGIPYNLSGSNKIYFNRSEEDGTTTEYLDSSDYSLKRKLRTVRESGGVRFVVNHHGIVLTKKLRTPSSRYWIPVYVGRIDYKNWFNKEE
jgi:hypothetical protein